jgi:hypothetical protein
LVDHHSHHYLDIDIQLGSRGKERFVFVPYSRPIA